MVIRCYNVKENGFENSLDEISPQQSRHLYLKVITTCFVERAAPFREHGYRLVQIACVYLSSTKKLRTRKNDHGHKLAETTMRVSLGGSRICALRRDRTLVFRELCPPLKYFANCTLSITHEFVRHGVYRVQHVSWSRENSPIAQHVVWECSPLNAGFQRGYQYMYSDLELISSAILPRRLEDVDGTSVG